MVSTGTSLMTHPFSPLGALPVRMSQLASVISPTPPSTTASRLSLIDILNQDESTDALKMTSTMDVQNSRHKTAISFILSSSDTKLERDQHKTRKRDAMQDSNVIELARSVKEIPMTAMINSTRRATSKPVGRKGSKFCAVEGCPSRAKLTKRCWKHGGWVRCKVSDCTNRAKCKGVCWSHGGGTVCSFKNCSTIAVSNGFCWAHGGGKRCQVLTCSKPAYERTQNYCQTHYNDLVVGV